ncbi:MAG: hypothetical protein ACOYOA_04865 [Saprospiraceae bacterium]
MKSLLFLATFWVWSISSFAIGAGGVPDSLQLPKVFILGEHEKDFEKLQNQYSTSLLSICGYNPDATFDKWAQFLIDMEDYSESINYDLKGVKMWIEVFWQPNGSVKHIAYALKPQSRNVETKELSAFMSSFIGHYKPRFQPNKKISHSSHAFFPLTAQIQKPGTGNR